MLTRYHLSVRVQVESGQGHRLSSSAAAPSFSTSQWEYPAMELSDGDDIRSS
jgi:hypothetical protein